MKSHSMTTADLITLLKRLDPTGTALVTEFRKESGYNGLLSMIDVAVTDLVPSPKPRSDGDYLASVEYAERYPHGHQKPVTAIVIGSTR